MYFLQFRSKREIIKNKFKKKGKFVGSGCSTNLEPASDVLVQLWIQNGIFESGQWAVGVNVATLVEDVTVALELVARSTRNLEQGLDCGPATGFQLTIGSCVVVHLGIHQTALASGFIR